ncbi:MAG: hypothetical protein AAF570_15930, partial [Bacteroidota bacterium]
MKRISILAFLLTMFALPQVQAQTMITIKLDATQMVNPDCWLGNGVVPNDKAYIHAGLCSSASAFCNDSIAGFGS